MASKITIKAERRIPLPTTYAYLNLEVLAEDTYDKLLSSEERQRIQNAMLIDAEAAIEASMQRIGVESDKPECWAERKIKQLKGLLGVASSKPGAKTKTKKGEYNG